MWKKFSMLVVCLALCSLGGIVACGVAGAGSPSIQLESALTTATPGVPANKGQNQSVDVTPMSPTELAAQPPGSTNPGAAEKEGPTVTPPAPSGGTGGLVPLKVFTDTTYKFSISYPADFVMTTQNRLGLAPLQPTPVAGYTFTNPETAKSSVPDEPADLDLRVYNAAGTTTLDEWLAQNDFTVAGGKLAPKPFQTPHVSGVEVCSATMIVPNCWYFVYGAGWVYQLTPVTLAGDAMVQTFTLLP